MCKKEWPGDQFVGERAVIASRRPNPSAPQTAAQTSNAPNGHANDSDEGSAQDEEDEESEEDEEAEEAEG